MNNFKQQLYDRLDKDEDLTDEERREIYFSEIAAYEEKQYYEEF